MQVLTMKKNLIESPGLLPHTFLNFPTISSMDEFDADIAILGIPYGMPYNTHAMANDQSRAAGRDSTVCQSRRYSIYNRALRLGP